MPVMRLGADGELVSPVPWYGDGARGGRRGGRPPRAVRGPADRGYVVTGAAALEIVELVLRGLAAVAPHVAEALTGGQTVDEALAAAREAAQGVPAVSGPDGQWAAEDEAQDERVRGEG